MMNKARTWIVLALVTGCGGDKGSTTDAGMSETSGSPDETGTTGEPTTSATDGGTAGDTADGGSSGADASTADGAGGYDCAGHCSHLMNCMLGNGAGLDECIEECKQTEVGLEDLDGCKAAYGAILACELALTCEELMGPSPCQDEYNNAGQICGDPGCIATSTSDGEDSCEIALECTGQPTYEMRCEQGQCTCLIDGLEDGTCVNMGYCLPTMDLDDPGLGEEDFAECCGY